MGVKKYNPTTAGRRLARADDFSDITKFKPEKNLMVVRKKNAGRNAQGKITVRHRGGGHKRKLRIIDWMQEPDTNQGTVLGLEYDPNRTARIALVEYEGGERKYILAPAGLTVGQKILSHHETIDVQTGNRTKLGNIPTGTLIHNVEIQPGKGATMVRAAGTAATLLAVEGESAQVKLPSGEVRIFSKHCMATVGQVSNPDNRNFRLGKAGKMRWLGFRPTVRGKAMNPVDHPHGGGEGNTSIGLKHPKTPLGKPALGVKTRTKKKKSNKFIIKRRKGK